MLFDGTEPCPETLHTPAYEATYKEIVDKTFFHKHSISRNINNIIVSKSILLFLMKGSSTMEIERKYAINYIDGDLAAYHSKKIEQGYLCQNPTLRIRKSNLDYILTYKSKDGIDLKEGGAIIHNEVELPLTEEAYLSLKLKIDGNLVYKTRYLIPLDKGLTAELDIFEGVLTGLIFVEVEFPDEMMADEFVPPKWFGKELSADNRFSNHHLSKLSSYEELNFENI